MCTAPHFHAQKDLQIKTSSIKKPRLPGNGDKTSRSTTDTQDQGGRIRRRASEINEGGLRGTPGLLTFSIQTPTMNTRLSFTPLRTEALSNSAVSPRPAVFVSHQTFPGHSPTLQGTSCKHTPLEERERENHTSP
ncbi:hypothetical protein JOB18_047405 [Solea senegalensis]|uniref:Uncharacterized protein n=1 Tax=Solea senegalensis TaxID=28829 RepID=A0AAV6RFE6_SOLSE|nr:hypothetical protein JOB18_047405 [Solea senegalensis]